MRREHNARVKITAAPSVTTVCENESAIPPQGSLRVPMLTIDNLYEVHEEEPKTVLVARGRLALR